MFRCSWSAAQYTIHGSSSEQFEQYLSAWMFATSRSIMKSLQGFCLAPYHASFVAGRSNDWRPKTAICSQSLRLLNKISCMTSESTVYEVFVLWNKFFRKTIVRTMRSRTANRFQRLLWKCRRSSKGFASHISPSPMHSNLNREQSKPQHVYLRFRSKQSYRVAGSVNENIGCCRSEVTRCSPDW